MISFKLLKSTIRLIGGAITTSKSFNSLYSSLLILPDEPPLGNGPKLKLNNNYHVKNFLKDHRIFMLSVVAALTLGGNWKINDKDSINSSFPNFLKISKKLGGKIN